MKVSFCVEKFWLPNLEWERVENWVEKRLPEMDTRVIFPIQMRHAAGMSQSFNLRLSGIDLARSGSLILPRNGNLQLSEAGKSTRKTSEWLRSGHLFWADPQNWNGSSIAAPHLEQVPCRQDDIVLPEKKRTFSVFLPMKYIEVKSIRTSGEKHPLAAWQWADLENRREFAKGIFTVKYADYSCEKCSCQDDPNGYYLEEICAIQRPKCGFIPCEYPLWVEGHCCHYCGARLSLTNKASLSIVRAAADETLEGYGKRFAWHVRRTWSGAAEVLIKEKGAYSGIDMLKIVDDLKRALTSMKIEVLSADTTGAALEDSRLTVTLVPLFVTPMVILMLLFLSCFYFGYSHRHVLSGCREVFSSIRDGIRPDKSQPGKPFSFARFENLSEGNVQIANVVVESETKAEGSKIEVEDPFSGGRFENPLYRTKRRRNEESEVLNMEAPLSLTTLRDKVEDEIVEVDLDINE
ncbi:PREDICTED: protein amnionless-like [Habropoda laboriosa]|nr:PREDICTED: protein amnionless-like [Habropoda laboriosa]